MDLTNFTIYANSSLFNDEFVVQIGVWRIQTLTVYRTNCWDADPRRGLIEDLDDDGDNTPMSRVIVSPIHWTARTFQPISMAICLQCD